MGLLSMKAGFMTDLYPMLFEPVLKFYLWGGRHLAVLGRDLPEGQVVAESWDIAAHKDGTTRLINGALAGQSLQGLVDEWGLALVGEHNRWALERGKFPWLVKLLDANQRLSVQVHPTDAYARIHEGNELGKTEMWVVLQAEPEAAIVYGFSRPISAEDLRQAIAAGDLDPLLNILPIKAGDHVCVPAGTLHAILEGAVIAEIQQNSNTTYRVYDWNRLDRNGQPRELHVDKAIEAINYAQVEVSLPTPEILTQTDTYVQERLCQNPTFTVERFRMQAEYVLTRSCDPSSMEIWGLLAGEATVGGVPLSPVQFVLLPATLGEYTVQASADAIFLRVFASP